MDILELKMDLINELSMLPAYKNPNHGVQHVVRCPYCGDSIKSFDHGHFSIKIVPDNDFPIIYRCLRCDESGLFTQDTLRDLNIGTNASRKAALHTMNRKSKKILSKYNIVTEVPRLSIPLYTERNYKNARHIAYLENRLGIEVTPGMLHDMKVIPDIYDFIKLNELENIEGVSLAKLDFLNNNYVGFLSTNNNVITYRYTGNNPKARRYDKIIINPRAMIPYSFYNTPIAFDLLYDNPINIHITEGTFDVLSIKYNVMNGNDINNYYFATCTFGYTRIIKYLLGIGLNTGINLHLYGDKDKDDRTILKDLNKIRSIMGAWIDNTYLHRNTYPGEKDYGVPKDRIIDSVRRFDLR